MLTRIRLLCKERLLLLKIYEDERLAAVEQDDSEEDIRNMEERERDLSVGVENKIQMYVDMLAEINGCEPSQYDRSDAAYVVQALYHSTMSSRPLSSQDEEIFRNMNLGSRSTMPLTEEQPPTASRLRNRMSKAFTQTLSAASNLKHGILKPTPRVKTWQGGSSAAGSPSRGREGSVSSSAVTPTQQESAGKVATSTKKLKKIFKKEEKLSTTDSQLLSTPSNSRGRRWSLSSSENRRSLEENLPRAVSDFTHSHMATIEARESSEEPPNLRKKSFSLSELEVDHSPSRSHHTSQPPEQQQQLQGEE